MAHGQEYNSPKDIPIIERCAKRASQKGDLDKGEAIAACTRRAKEAGRIRKKDNGKWVVVQQQQAQGQQRPRRRQRRAR